jgi:hypothetical protein
MGIKPRCFTKIGLNLLLNISHVTDTWNIAKKPMAKEIRRSQGSQKV